MTRPKSAAFTGWRVVAISAVLLYLCLALYQLELPGLHYDEALDAAPALQTVLGKRIDSTYTLDLGGRKWPLMVLQWIGATTTYLLIAAFGVFGVSATVLRATGVLVGVLSLLLAWGFLREFFDERVATLSSLMLAISPGFVFWSRMMALVHFVLLPIAIATIWLLFRWYKRRQGRYLVLAAFGLGWGLQTHIMFLLLWGGLGLAWLLLSPWLGEGHGWRRWLWPWQITGSKACLLSALAVLLGAAPLLVYNLQHGATLSYAMERLASGESGQVRNLESLTGAIGSAFRGLRALVSGRWFGSRMGGLHQNLLALPALGLALVLIGWLATRSRLSFSPKRVCLFAILVLSIALLRALVEGDFGAYHLLLVWPMPQALVAVALFSLADTIRQGLPPEWSFRPRGSGLPLGALGLVAFCLVGAEAWTSVGYHRTLTKTGGVGYFSDAIYALAEDLEQPGTPQSIAMDWGFRRNLQVLTQDRVDPPEWFTYNTPPGEEFEGYVRELISRYPNALYLFHAPERTAFQGHREIFEEVAYRHHLSPVLWKTYYQRNGEPVYQLYTIKATPRLFEQPIMDYVLDVQLDERLALLGYDVPQDQVQRGEDINLTLYWKALASPRQESGTPPAGNYKVFAHLLDDSGKLWGQHDDFPAYGSYPMTDWLPGEVVPDRIKIELGEDVPPGNYHVFVGMYDPSTGERLPLLRDGERLKGDTLGLTDIRIAGPGAG